MQYATNRTDRRTDVETKLEIEHASVGLAHTRPIRIVYPMLQLLSNSIPNMCQMGMDKGTQEPSP